MIDHVEVIAEVTSAIRSIYSEIRLGKIQVHWMTDDELLEVNKEHLNHDYYTDIITFDYSRQGCDAAGPMVIGVLCICSPISACR